MRRSITALLLFAGALLVTGGSATADAKDEVVITVGSAQMTFGEVERRFKAIPPWQLPTLGATPGEIRKNFVEKVLIPELLAAEEAKHRKLENDPAVHDRVREILRQAMENRLRETVANEKSIPADEVKAYYEQNLHRFHTPRRIKLWRILLPDEAAAKKLIADLKTAGPGSAKLWTETAREKSLDKATHMRDGNLGFVHPDGQTEAPRVRVDVALFTAAERVKDGEIVSEPVKEGDGWAVVWRRGSMEEVHRTLEQEEGAIRQVLRRKKLEDAMTKLLEGLKSEQVKGVNEQLLDYVEVDAYGEVGARKKPGVVPRSAVGSPAPKPGERGTR